MGYRHRMRAALAAASLALVALPLGACADEGGGAVEVAPGQTTPPGQPAQPTTDPEDLAQGSSGGSDEPETVVDPNGDAKAPDDSHTVAIGATFQMPRIVGMDLQAAQDLLQGRNSYKMDQNDATGRGRKLLKDTDWKVCRQSPGAGRYVPIDTNVRVWAVKAGETCP